jgi:hypothetical protein
MLDGLAGSDRAGGNTIIARGWWFVDKAALLAIDSFFVKTFILGTAIGRQPTLGRQKPGLASAG